MKLLKNLEIDYNLLKYKGINHLLRMRIFNDVRTTNYGIFLGSDFRNRRSSIPGVLICTYTD